MRKYNDSFNFGISFRQTNKAERHREFEKVFPFNYVDDLKKKITVHREITTSFYAKLR